MAKILVVGNILVPPIIAGSCRCISNYSSLLLNQGHEVHYLYSGYSTPDEDEKANLYWNGKYHHYQYSLMLRAANLLYRKLYFMFHKHSYSIDYYYPVFGLEDYLSKLHRHEHFDAIIVNYPWMSKLLTRTDIPKKILFTHDKFTNKKQLINAEYYSLTEQQEKDALNRADVVLSIQDEETVFFKKLLPHKEIRTVYTTFDFQETTLCGNDNILFFSGNSDLNLNGIVFFISKVLPLILEERPKAKLLIAGSICKALSTRVLPENVILEGFVNDPYDFYKKGDISINPVYQGTGLKIKTLESISFGKITVVHPHSIEGLYKHKESPVFVGDTPESYAKIIIKALNRDIDFYENQDSCKRYIAEMNQYINKQFKEINL